MAVVLHAGGVSQGVDAGFVLYTQVLIDEYSSAVVLLDVQVADHGEVGCRRPRS